MEYRGSGAGFKGGSDGFEKRPNVPARTAKSPVIGLTCIMDGKEYLVTVAAVFDYVEARGERERNA
jgi:hypothetical protein